MIKKQANLVLRATPEQIDSNESWDEEDRKKSRYTRIRNRIPTGHPQLAKTLMAMQKELAGPSILQQEPEFVAEPNPTAASTEAQRANVSTKNSRKKTSERVSRRTEVGMNSSGGRSSASRRIYSSEEEPRRTIDFPKDKGEGEGRDYKTPSSTKSKKRSTTHHSERHHHRHHETDSTTTQLPVRPGGKTSIKHKIATPSTIAQDRLTSPPGEAYLSSDEGINSSSVRHRESVSDDSDDDDEESPIRVTVRTSGASSRVVPAQRKSGTSSGSSGRRQPRDLKFGEAKAVDDSESDGSWEKEDRHEQRFSRIRARIPTGHPGLASKMVAATRS